MKNWLVLLTPLFGWFAAQGLKFTINLHKDGLQIKDLYSSGGFPSAHTASTVSLATYLGAVNGWGSDIFVVSAMLTAVVMYDAVGVRRAVGRHVKLLKKLSEQNGMKYEIKGTETAFGHSPVEVAAGLALGVIIGLLVNLFN